MPTIKTYRKVGAFYIACEEDFATSIRTVLGINRRTYKSADGKTDSIGTLLQRVESCPKESFRPATVAL
jgi:hypothetical protein